MWDLLLVPIPLVLLTMLATYLMPSLTYMLHSLPFPPRVMSLTFLSFANAAPDLITCFTALRQGTAAATTMGVGEVIGSATFGLCVVFGTIAMLATVPDQKDGSVYAGLQVVGTKWLLDVSSLLAVALYIAYTVQDGKITLFDAIVLSLAYFAIISSWIWRSSSSTSGKFIDVNRVTSGKDGFSDLNAGAIPPLDEELLSIGRESQNSDSPAPPLQESIPPLRLQNNIHEGTVLSSINASEQTSHSSLQEPRIQSYNATAPMSPTQSQSYELEHGSVNAVDLSRKSSSINSVASQSSDLGEFYFHTNIDHLEKGNSWRLPLIDSVRLALVGMKNKGSKSVSRTSSMIKSFSNSGGLTAHKTKSPVESNSMGSSMLPPSLDPINEAGAFPSPYHVYSQPPSRSTSPPRSSKPTKKTPGIAVTDTVGHRNIITKEVESVGDAKNAADETDNIYTNPTPTSHLNADLERGLTSNASAIIHRSRSHSLSFEIASKVDLEGGFSGSIHYLTPNLFYRLCPLHMATKCQGIEKLYNLSIIPIITIFNLVIPLPIPAELREKDIASFKWEFALTRRLFHFQLFWLPWIFTDFGTVFSGSDNYWNNMIFCVIIPSLVFPIASFCLDIFLLRGKPPVEMPKNVVIRAFDESDHQQNMDTSEDESKEIFPIVLSLVSFIYVIKLLSLTTTLLVNLIMNIAARYHLSESLLAITIVSLANSAGDVITAAALTKLGRIDVAVSAVAGGTICYLCGGVGGVSLVTLLIGTPAGSGPDKGKILKELTLNVDSQIWVQIAAMVTMLTLCLVIVPCRNWLVERWVGAVGISIWLCGILFGWFAGF